MTLTLKITNHEYLQNGSPVEFVLFNRGAIIGRSPTCDWPLPDEERMLSRQHCKITYSDESYWLEDLSSNGTFINSEPKPVQQSYLIKSGDQIRLGPFIISTRLTGEALAQQNISDQSRSTAQQKPSWDNWNTGEDPPDIAPVQKPKSEHWDLPGEKTLQVSSWSDKPINGWDEPEADEIFGSLTENHEIDWSDTSWDVNPDFDPFAATESNSPLSDFDTEPVKAQSAHSSWLPEPEPPQGEWKNPISPTTQPVSQQALSPARTKTLHSEYPENTYRELITSLGISSSDIAGEPGLTSAKAGRILRRLIAGLMTLLEARARAKDAMGAGSTQLNLTGNNPLKFAPDIDKAINMVMNPPRDGYLDAEAAIEDSFRDIQAHQIATLKAMQGALRATLQRFSPDEIKQRADKKGFLKKIVPGQMHSALWKAYEKEFSGCVEGSSEAFLDTFSKEFRKAYEDATRK